MKKHSAWSGESSERSSFALAVTIEVATWLLDSIRKESNRTYKNAHERRSFMLGTANRLVQRAIEMVSMERSESTETAGTSLMVVRNELQHAVQEHLDALNLHPLRSKRVYINQAAYIERFFYFLEDSDPNLSGIIVFDELEKPKAIFWFNRWIGTSNIV